MHVSIIPYSSTVGSGIVLKKDGDPRAMAMLSLHSVTIPEGMTHKEQSEKIMRFVADAIEYWVVSCQANDEGIPY